MVLRERRVGQMTHAREVHRVEHHPEQQQPASHTPGRASLRARLPGDHRVRRPRPRSRHAHLRPALGGERQDCAGARPHGGAVHPHYFAGPALAALGRSGTLARIAALNLTLTVIPSLVGVPFGLTAIAGAYVVRAYLTLPVQMETFRRHSGVGYRAVPGAIAPALSMALVMAGCLLVLDHFVGARFHNRGVFLLFMVCSGAVIYAGSLLLFARSFVPQQIRDLRPLLPGAWAKLSGADA
jgi:hypothetical protein